MASLKTSFAVVMPQAMPFMGAIMPFIYQVKASFQARTLL